MELGCCSTESVCLKRLLRHITTIGITKGKRNAATGGNLGLRSHHRPSHQIDIYRLSRPINGTIGKDADILQRIFLHVIGKVSPSCIDRQSFVLRPEAGRRAALLRTLDALEEEERSTAYGHDLLARAQMLQLLVMLGRGLDDDGVNYAPSEHCNEKTAAILEYLNTHLTEDVSIDALADTFYLSKYYMMRMFREETGFTIHGYLTDKRLRVARDLIAQGMRTTDACFQCGYHDYSAFSRAYKKRFQVSPRADLTKGAQ